MAKKKTTDTCGPAINKGRVKEIKLPKKLKNRMIDAAMKYIQSQGFDSIEDFMENTDGVFDVPVAVDLDDKEQEQVDKAREKSEAEDKN